MVNKWTLEFAPNEVPEKHLSEYNKAKQTHAGFLLCSVQIANLLTDLALLIRTILSKDGYSDSAEHILKVTFSADFILGIVYYLAHFGIIRRAKHVPCGIIAGLCVTGIVVQTEISLLKPETLSELHSFLMFSYLIMCWIMVKGEDNFVLISTISLGSACYISLRVCCDSSIVIYMLACLFFLISNYTVISNRKALLLETLKSEKQSRRWKNLLLSHEDGTIIVSKEKKVIFCNHAFENLVAEFQGPSVEAKINEFLAKHSSLIDHEGNKRSVAEGLNMVLELEDGIYSLMDGPEPDPELYGDIKSTRMKYAIHKKKILFESSDANLIIIRDFSGVENLQRMVAEGKFRTVLLSTITHDIKTPLTIILGNLALLRNYIKTEGNEFYNAVYVATETLEYFMRDIIDMKKIVEGTFRLKHTTISMKSLLDKLQSILCLAARMKRLEFRIESTVERQLFTDEQRLMQVLLNLTTNAVKYTKKGKVEVVAEEDRDSVVIRIQDTGIGIEETDRKNVFKMFGMIDRKAARCETGVGTGMYLAKHIVDAMGGSLELESEVGVGTRIVLRIPSLQQGKEPLDPGSVVLNADEAAGTNAKTEGEKKNLSMDSEDRSSLCTGALPCKLLPASSHELKLKTELVRAPSLQLYQAETEESKFTEIRKPVMKKNVLVVEDDPLVLLAIKNMIQKLGYHVETAENGRTAVDKVRERNASRLLKYDLIITDINMPVMNGYTAATLINCMISEGEILPVPIVCVSAQDSPEHQAMCKEAGIVEHCKTYRVISVGEKPISVGKLRSVLKKYVRDDVQHNDSALY